MLDYNNIIKMPIKELLVYYNSLNSICSNYETELKPLFNSHVPSEQQKWNSITNDLQKARTYRNIVLNAMKEKCYYELDNYKPFEKTKTKPIPKKQIVKQEKTPKK